MITAALLVFTMKLWAEMPEPPFRVPPPTFTLRYDLGPQRKRRFQ